MMNYYKLIHRETVIGIASSLDFRAFQQKHGILLLCDEQKGQYLQCGESLYRDDWMRPITTDTVPYECAEVIAVDKEEYDLLSAALNKGEAIDMEPQEERQEEQSEAFEESPNVTLEFVRAAKLNEMSAACRKAITDGFDVALSDGETRHFSLTVQDQLNLLTISTDILSGESEIIYHADGEVCKYYSVEDATAIVNAATKHKTYHTTYYNSLKVYINSLDNITDISNIEYGVEIPEEYQSDILKSLIQENINDENNTIEDEESNAEVDDIINNDSIVEDE